MIDMLKLDLMEGHRATANTNTTERGTQRAHTDSGRQSFVGALVVLTRLTKGDLGDLGLVDQ